MPFGTILRQDELVAIPQGWREFTAPASGVREIINWTIEALRQGTRVVQDLTFDMSRLFSDVAGTIPIAGPGAEVAAQKDARGVIVRTQTTLAARPIYAIEPASGVRQLAVQTSWADAVAGTPGTPPTGWTITTVGAPTSTLVGGLDARGAQAVRFDGVLNDRCYYWQDIDAIAGVTYRFSCEITAVSGQTGAALAVLASSATGTSTNVVSITTPGRYTAVFVCTGSGTMNVRVGLGVTNGIPNTGSITVSQPMVEIAAAPTTYQQAVTQFDVTEIGVRSVHALAYDRFDDWMQLVVPFQPAGGYTLAMGHTHRVGETTRLFGHSVTDSIQMVRASGNELEVRANTSANRSLFPSSGFTAAATGRAVAIARVAGTGLADGYMNGFGPLAGTLTGAMTPPNAAGINAIGRQGGFFEAPRREYGGVLIDPGNTPVTNEEITLMLRHLAHNEGITL